MPALIKVLNCMEKNWWILNRLVRENRKDVGARYSFSTARILPHRRGKMGAKGRFPVILENTPRSILDLECMLAVN